MNVTFSTNQTSFERYVPDHFVLNRPAAFRVCLTSRDVQLGRALRGTSWSTPMPERCSRDVIDPTVDASSVEPAYQSSTVPSHHQQSCNPSYRTMLRAPSIMRLRVGLCPTSRMVRPWTFYSTGSRSVSVPTGQTPTPAQAKRGTNGGSTDTDDGPVLPHFAQRDPGGKPRQSEDPLTWDHPVPHPVYDIEIIREIPQTHHGPRDVPDRIASVLCGCYVEDSTSCPATGGCMTEQAWLNRCLFLETVAGVPGMVGGMTRHLHSLRRMRRDYGWIHTLLGEAENERMHLIIFTNLKQPGSLMRAMVLAAQGVFFNLFFLSYLVSPRTCHRFVGYLEEEAVKTYTGLLDDIQHNHILAHWQTQAAPVVARKYYKLPEDASLADMVLCIRADEANHRDVNHTFAALDPDQDVNPFIRRQKAQDKQHRA